MSTLSERYKAKRERWAYIGTGEDRIEIHLVKPDIKQALMEARDKGLNLAANAYQAAEKARSEGADAAEIRAAWIAGLEQDNYSFGLLGIYAAAVVDVPADDAGTMQVPQFVLRHEDIEYPDVQMCVFDLCPADADVLSAEVFQLMGISVHQARVIAPFPEPADADTQGGELADKAEFTD